MGKRGRRDVKNDSKKAVEAKKKLATLAKIAGATTRCRRRDWMKKNVGTSTGQS